MKYFKTNGLTGNPANVFLFFFDREIPLCVRLTMFAIGCTTWGALILTLTSK